MTDTETTADSVAAETTAGITPTQRRVALIALLVVAFLFVARPTTLRFGESGRTASCGLTTYVFGSHEPAVTQACRNAFDGRAAAALILLGGIALLAAEFVPKRDSAADDSVSPPEHPPGDDPSFVGGLRNASTDPSFRILAGLGVALLVVLGVVLRPLEVQASVLGEERTVSCGFRDYLFGADDGTVTATCREAYAARAGSGLIVLLGLGVAVAMMAWIVQYHRGAALGSIWHRAGIPSRLLARTGGGCAVLAVVALFAAAQGASPATSRRGELASAPAPPLDAPVGDEVIPQPTFAAYLPVAPPPLTGAGPSDTVSTATSPRARPSPPPSDEPLTVRDPSWYTANPSPLYAATVPEDSLPVGATGGEDDVHAFFRVSGTARTLTLVESDALGSQWFAEQPQVAACPVKAAGWKQTEGGHFDDQPPFDDGACVDAVADDGTWTIDLGSFDGRGGERGFALIPAVDADGETFRVTLVPPPR